MDNNLKSYREKELKNYVIGNVLVVLALSGAFDALLCWTENNESINNVFTAMGSELISAGIISSILYTYVFIFDAIIPGNWKDKICNLCRPIPGELIFEEMRKEVKDKRFTQEEALQKYTEIYAKLNSLTGKKKKKHQIHHGMLFIANMKM